MPESDATRPTEKRESSRIITLTFSNQTPQRHLIGIVAGVVLWYLCYASYLTIVGGPTEAVWSSMAADAVHLRAMAATLATLMCGFYFGLLIVKGVGGPVLNLLYTGATFLVLPRLVHHLLGTVPEGYFTNASPVSRIAFRAIQVEIVVPGMFAVLLVPVVWFALVCRDETARREWVRQNLPEFLPDSEP